MGKRFSILICVAAAVAVALPSQVGAAAFPGENGRIAFQSNRSGQWEIYTMRSDGSDETRLTRTGAYNGQPAISPDGRKIAFIRDSARESSQATGTRPVNPVGRFGVLWIMNSDGTDQRQLTDRRSANPAFSPDGKRITFSSVSDSGCAFGISWENIFVFTISSGAAQKLTKVCDPAFNPTFSPDGSEVLFQGTSFRDTGFGNDAVLWVDSHRTQPDSTPGRAAPASGPFKEIKGFSLGSNGKVWAQGLRIRSSIWIPFNEPMITVSTTGGPCVACARGNWGDLENLRKLTVGSPFDDVRPSFAPEGDWIAFERRPDKPSTDIYKVSNPPARQAVELKQLTVTGKNMAPDWGPRTP